jgi:fermentation-respiration switch protein FrsA (DUF1100 family)
MQLDSQAISSFLQLLSKSAFIAFVLVAVCTYIYFCPPVLTMTNGGFILFPMPPGEEYKCTSVNNVQREEVWFKNEEGNKLNGWFFQSPNKNAPVILFSHGNAGNIGHRLMLVKALMDAGASVFVYDYRAYGLSEGKKNLQGLSKDAHAAYNYLVEEKKLAPQKIILYGESIGGGPTCMLASQVKCGGIILDSTFTSLLRVAKKKVAYFNVYPDFLQTVPSMDNFSFLKEKHAPVLIIHGEKDEVIPYSEAQENFAAASEPKQFVSLPHATHNWKEPDWNLYIEGIHKFLQETQSK